MRSSIRPLTVYDFSRRTASHHPPAPPQSTLKIPPTKTGRNRVDDVLLGSAPVPSWLQQFSMGANARFTRTPDYLLRSRQPAPDETGMVEPAAPLVYGQGEPVQELREDAGDLAVSTVVPEDKSYEIEAKQPDKATSELEEDQAVASPSKPLAALDELIHLDWKEPPFKPANQDEEVSELSQPQQAASPSELRPAPHFQPVPLSLSASFSWSPFGLLNPVLQGAAVLKQSAGEEPQNQAVAEPKPAAGEQTQTAPAVVTDVPALSAAPAAVAPAVAALSAPLPASAKPFVPPAPVRPTFVAPITERTLPVTASKPEAPVMAIAATGEASVTIARDEDAFDEDLYAYELPPLSLLSKPPVTEPCYELSEEYLEATSEKLERTLHDFGVKGEIIDANPGPVVTLYELEPAPGTQLSRVISVSSDIARSMSAVSARVAVVEGRNIIGIELPNQRRETVWLRELLSSPDFAEAKAKLGLCLGKTIGGEPVIADLARMPHLLVAGTTGSGKSVAINTMILSLLYRHKPEDCRLIMIDPKMLELSVYEGIPHLLTPVVTDPKKAVVALKWAVREMEERYRKMSHLGVRNIDGYNARLAEARAKDETIVRRVQIGFDRETGDAVYEEQEMDLTPLPYIVVIVDEMADLMMVAGKEIESAIQRLAQMARAAGIHIIIDRKSTRLNSSHQSVSRMPSSA